MIAKFCIINIDFDQNITTSGIFAESKEKQLFSKAQKQLQSSDIGYKIIKHSASKYTIFAIEPGSKIDRALFINEENIELGKLYAYRIEDYYYVAKYTENGWADIYLPLTETEIEMLPEQPTILAISDEKQWKLSFNNLETEKFIKIGLLSMSAILILTTVFQIFTFKLDQSEIDNISIETKKRVENYNQAYFKVVEDVKNIKSDYFEMSNKILEISKICNEGIVKKYTYAEKSEDLLVHYDIMHAKKADSAIDNLKKNGFEVTSNLDKTTDRIILTAKRIQK